MKFIPVSHSQRRKNPLTDEWVLVSPQRSNRPWQGQLETAPNRRPPIHDPSCPLCPGNDRVDRHKNPDYKGPFVFDNDFSALTRESPPESTGTALFETRAVRGRCRVLCFSPRHDLTLPEMEISAIRRVVDSWVSQTASLGETHRWVQIFENKGAAMGCSNAHPHGQIWALDAWPNEPFKEDLCQRRYWKEAGKSMLVDYAAIELEKGDRVVLRNQDWVAVVPYWAVWPFETLLLPLRSVSRLPDLHEAERQTLAAILKCLLSRYDNLFETSFPYSMGWHGAPFVDDVEDASNAHWQLHAHFYPPLLRSATIKKFSVGFEMLGEAQRDLTAEEAAQRLRDLPDEHYKQCGT